MNTKMGFGRKFAYSFFDFSAYKSFLVQGLGKSILYIFLVTLIFSTISNIRMISTLNSDISTIQDNLRDNAPNFELKNGLFSVDSDEPIYYKNTNNLLFPLIISNLEFVNILHSVNLDNNASSQPGSEIANNLPDLSSDDTGYSMLIVDSSGKTDVSTLNSYSNGIYIDNYSLTFRNNYQTIGTINFADYNDIILTNKTIYKTLIALKMIIPIISLIFTPILAFIGTLGSGFLILAPLCLNISSIIGAKLNYSKAAVLSFYAMTLPLLLETLLNIAGLTSPEFTIIFYIISLLYCGLAIKKIKDIDKSNLKFTH